MQGSNLGYRTWAIAVYLLTTSRKSVSSCQLARLLGIRQATAWHLAARGRPKAVVAGVRCRISGRVSARVMRRADRGTLQRFVMAQSRRGRIRAGRGPYEWP